MNQNYKVLVVEDSSTQALQIAAQLSQFEIDVIIAEDGPQALRLVDHIKPSLIVLDLNLPSMDGYQVCYRLKRDPHTAHIPVIMLTASDSDDAKKKGFEVGADDYIVKDRFAANNLLETANRLGLFIKT